MPQVTIVQLTLEEEAQYGQGKYWVCVDGVRHGYPLSEEAAIAKKKALKTKKPDDDPGFSR